MSNPLRALEHENFELRSRIEDQEALHLRIKELEAKLRRSKERATMALCALDNAREALEE